MHCLTPSLPSPFPLRRWSFSDCHVSFPAVLAEVCAEQGVERFIHMSALGASTMSESHLLRSKAVGEIGVKEGFPSATIFRPATVFGDEDKFLNRKAIFARHLPFFPLVDGGAAKAQPVYVDDIAKAVVAVLGDPSSAGKTYSLAGPKAYTQKELAEFVFKSIGDEPLTISTPKPVALAGAAIAGLIPAPWMTPDLVRPALTKVHAQGTFTHSPATAHTLTLYSTVSARCARFHICCCRICNWPIDAPSAAVSFHLRFGSRASTLPWRSSPWRA
jgi:hypothetical protein